MAGINVGGEPKYPRYDVQDAPPYKKETLSDDFRVSGTAKAATRIGGIGGNLSDFCGSDIPQQGRHPNSARFHQLLKEIGNLHDRKQADYGRGDDPFANVRASNEWGVKPWVGAMVRANDKVKRLQAFIANGRLLNEGVSDSLRDLAVYALIALVLFEQEECATQRCGSSTTL